MEKPSSGDQFNLKWNNHMANFIQIFIEHQNQESLVDVTLSCEGQYIKAHKLILAACSDYFQSVFQIHSNVTQPFILLNGIRFRDLKYILHFMYHGEVKVLDKDLPNVLALGQSLQIKGLCSVKLKDMPDHESPRPNINQSASNMEIESRPPSNLLPTEVPKTYLPDQRNDLNQDIDGKSTKLSSFPAPVVRNSTQTGPNNQHTNEIISDLHPPLKKRKNLTENTSAPSIKLDNHPEAVDYKPRSPFMIFAKDWRPKLAAEYPDKSNKEISIKLGNIWKALTPETKKAYYTTAKKTEKHKQKYTDCTFIGEDVKKLKSDAYSGNNSPVDPLMMIQVDEESILLSEDE
ncbi:broad-complex core protein isoforms 1/2/3/4/5-like [Cylas formicarius]|uniref:broad-complex core protein isoforms 1/2/3/4/5-like n=1 Tax=Cylas formicarius TaxID=197179 RepID=UPI002958946D|nr:broad-complex core protein isoforms 1/2/3/4/5-like [Cylas formicarius]XP_060531136.1 broad-complex core protein isoforms 1/2/3/4/5-like [Cylas formicarius]